MGAWVDQHPATGLLSAGAAAINALGEPGFPDVFLALTAEAVPVDLCSAFALDQSGRMRFLFASGWTPHASDFARAASTGYARTYWRSDPMMARLPGPAATAAITCQRGDKIADKHYRQACYEAPGVVERVSIQGRTGAGLIQVGLYRTRDRGFFTAEDLTRLKPVGDVLVALAAKHGAMTAVQTASLAPDRGAVQDQVASMYAGLSRRECEVCAALLCGSTAKEAARLIGIEPSSVVTYRKRAFAKLGLATTPELLRRYRDDCTTS